MRGFCYCLDGGWGWDVPKGGGVDRTDKRWVLEGMGGMDHYHLSCHDNRHQGIKAVHYDQHVLTVDVTTMSNSGSYLVTPVALQLYSSTLVVLALIPFR